MMWMFPILELVITIALIAASFDRRAPLLARILMDVASACSLYAALWMANAIIKDRHF